MGSSEISFEVVEEIHYRYKQTGKPVSLYTNSFIVEAESSDEKRSYEISIEYTWPHTDPETFGEYLLYVAEYESYNNAKYVIEKPSHYYQEILEFWLKKEIHQLNVSSDQAFVNFENELKYSGLVSRWELLENEDESLALN